MRVMLNRAEIDLLFLQDPSQEGRGGYQSLLVKLQRKVRLSTGEMDLSEQDLRRIPKYAFDYGKGGWEDRFKGIFGRVLGSGLGR